MSLSSLWSSRLRPVAPAMLLLAAAFSVSAQDGKSVLKYAGVNLSGAEFNSGKKPGTLYKDYTYPGPADYSYFAGKGMNIVRLPFLWERLQPTAKGEFDPAQLGQIKKAVAQAKASGVHLILDPHNYAKYNGALIGSAGAPAEVFADLWRRLATEFKNDDTVIFGLMNEPNAVSSTDWAAAAQAAINAIRKAGAKNLVLVPGTAYTGAHSWRSTYYGTSNAVALQPLKDPGNRMAFEAHQYFDKDNSGTKGECVSAGAGAEKLAGFVSWLRENKKVGFIGEFATADTPVCNQALEGMLSYIEQNKDVIVGWTWWAAGAWWKNDYPFNVQPNKDGSDRPQMSILSKHARKITGK
ncbi:MULTISPECIES: glycoside hydrolase family 5 protein [Xanthomonas translucens group]|uniref:glycoside hydrolase family 5 protein n=2 Tax=Xanthomonas TaxID=338 RepID=UPI0005792FAD|nr:glycoside hydrolase family 5 protein [Xanthomonas translucens]UKE47311.1 glycoside hydrolase family 5 protein [Xanthomonas translucens pv. cerealis]